MRSVVPLFYPGVTQKNPLSNPSRKLSAHVSPVLPDCFPCPSQDQAVNFCINAAEVLPGNVLDLLGYVCILTVLSHAMDIFHLFSVLLKFSLIISSFSTKFLQFSTFLQKYFISAESSYT